LRCGDLRKRARVVPKSAEDHINPIMTFPIKKRIDTELFFDGKLELYIHKRRIYKIDRNSESDVEKLAQMPG